MKRFLKISIVFLLSFVFVSVFAQQQTDPMQLPQLTQWVTDFSSTLNEQQLLELNTSAKEYETQSSNQLVTVVFPNRNGNALLDIGMKIFVDNQIGKKDINNGLLLLISSEEKKIRIIVGYGLEGVYPDLLASQVIENDIRPLVNSGDIAGAIKVFYEKSSQIIGGEIPVGYAKNSSQQPENFNYFALILGFFLGLGLRKSFKKGDKKIFKDVFAKITKKGIAFWVFLLVLIAFFVAIVFVGTIVFSIAIGTLFGYLGIMPVGVGRGGFGGGGFGAGSDGGGFDGGGGSSGGGGAGD